MVNAVVHLRHRQSTMAWDVRENLDVVRAAQRTDYDRSRHLCRRRSVPRSLSATSVSRWMCAAMALTLEPLSLCARSISRSRSCATPRMDFKQEITAALTDRGGGMG